MALKEIIGQDKALHILKGCIRKDRVPHAMLFAGDNGIGKYLTAINFAKTLNCQIHALDLFSNDDKPIPVDDSREIDSCDQCISCNKIEKGNHPDVFVLRPEGDGGQITVSSIRKLQESLSFKPFEGLWKIAIIDHADKLNQSAANAFLQTLEEPTRQSVLILVSSRPDMLLATIRSRCQKINFSPLPLERMSKLIEDKAGDIDIEHSEILSILSGGRLGLALNEDLIEQRNWSFDILEHMLGDSEEEAWSNREEMEQWFDWAQLWVRDLAVLKTTESSELLINRDLEEEIRNISKGAELREILILARELYNIRGRLYFNLNKQITFNYVRLLLKNRLGKVRMRKTG